MDVHGDPAIPPGASTPDDTVARYQSVLEHLERRGFRPVGRFKRFQSILRDHRDGRAVDQGLLAQAFLDLFQLAHVVERLGDSDDEEFLGKLKLVMSDPEDPQAKADTPGRNAQSELFLAAVLAARGVHVTFEEPDLVAHIDGLYFGLAVKRPKSLKSLRPNLEKAIRQLRREGTTNSTITHGIPAIDVTLLANREGRVAVARETGSAASAADQLVVDGVANHIEATDVMSTLLDGKGKDGVRLCCGVLVFGAVAQYAELGGVTNSVAFRTLRLGSDFRDALDMLPNAVCDT